jgi:molybdate transport system substrate-binding protein
VRWLISIAGTILLAGCGRGGASGAVTVSVAASLQNAMGEIAQSYQQSHPGVRVTFNFGGSGALAQQIERGAPADVFLAASPKPMDALSAKGLILPDTRRDLLRNQIVLIVPKDRSGPASFQDLASSKVKLIALGDPASVPAGDYGRQVLESLNLWAAVQPKLVLAKDVRQVLSYVETANTEAGIVYATDARESEKVQVAAVAPAGTHAPVTYPVAVMKASRNAGAARAFVSDLAGADARAIFARHGFQTVSP